MQNILIGVIIGFVLTFVPTVIGCIIVYDNELNSVGIERIARCEINTSNCHSNWNEIVWIDK